MRNSFTIATVFDIEIRADLSWALGFGVILWSLASFYLPANYPALRSLYAWSLALAVTTFLYVSITAHELGHSPSRHVSVFQSVRSRFSSSGDWPTSSMNPSERGMNLSLPSPDRSSASDWLSYLGR